MSYSPEQHQELVNAEEKRLNQQLSICRDLKLTLDSAGWKNTIGPLIDRLITEVAGGKLGDTWVSGKLDRARKDEKREFYIGFKQALIELHGRIMFHSQQIPVIEERLKSLQLDKQEKYRVPLVDDTRYNSEGEDATFEGP
jgi:hypothetical protein